MDSYGVNKKNPYKFNFVKNKINQALKEYKDKFIIIKIPVVSSLIYGRKVGYKIKKIHFFYMLLAGTQYLILISIFDEFVTYNIREILNLSTLVVISSIIGFKLNQFLKDNSYSKLIDLMAIFASIILILKIFFSA